MIKDWLSTYEIIITAAAFPSKMMAVGTDWLTVELAVIEKQFIGMWQTVNIPCVMQCAIDRC